MKFIFAIFLFLILNQTKGQDISYLFDKSWEAEKPIKISEEQTLQAFQLILKDGVNFKKNVVFQEAVISEKIIDSVHYATSASFRVTSDSIHFQVNMDYWGFREGDLISLSYKWVDENEILVQSKIDKGVFRVIDQ